MGAMRGVWCSELWLFALPSVCVYSLVILLTMDSAFDRLCKIQPGKEAWRIKVRILRLWSVPSYMNPERMSSIEMVLVDEEGGKIHASVRRNLLYVFEKKLTEGAMYKMCFFGVVPYTGSYRTTSHEYKLLFQLKTKISLVDGSKIPTHAFSFVNSSDVCKHQVDSDFLVDAIGLLTAVSAEKEYMRDGKLTKMVVMELTDHTGRVECALFGEYVDELNKFMSNGTGEMPIVIIQFAKIKIFKGNAVIQNVLQTSRLFFNTAIAEVDEFRNGLALHGVEADQPISVIGDGGMASKEDEFLKMYPKKTIAELHETEEDGIFVVSAKIIGLVEGLDWWYPACRCYRAVAPDSGLYYCDGCYHHVLQVIPRFRLNVDVADGTESAVFVIFDNDVQLLTKKNCVDLVSNFKLGPSVSYPKELEVVIGKELLFKVEKKTDMSSFFDVSYCVKRVCDDESVINLFHNQGRGLTPEKSVFQASFPPVVSLDDDEDPVQASQTSSFVSSLIVSPSPIEEGSCSQSLQLGSAKRKLDDVFEGLEDLDVKMPLKDVKTEK